MQIKDIANYLEKLAPLPFQEDYDNAGLIVGNQDETVTGVLVCLDSTEAVVDEAIRRGCNLIVAHHPIIFKGLKKLTGKNYIERTIIKAIKNDVAIYASHTNLDNVMGGVNFKIAEKLGLQNAKILLPKTAHSSNLNVGSGAIGMLEKPLETQQFLSHLKEVMQTGIIKHTALLKEKVQTVAVCGGAGGFLLSNAIAAGADIFITSDYKYHEFFDAENRITIADIGHYESEQYTKELIVDYLSEKFTNFAICLSETSTNPVFYY
jgi:dinuclear metal center YbgI/SA1388 family protein